MGGARKVFAGLAGEPVLMHVLRPFLADTRVTSVVVALASDDAAAPPSWLTALDERVAVVRGGATRTASVRAALAALPDDTDVIAVHDGARPLVPPDAVAAAIDLAAGGVAAVVGCRAVDTIKRADARGDVLETPERSALWHAQTPQVFPAALLRAAYADPSAQGTDDAALVEHMGARVRMVDGGRFNLKLTHPGDLALAEAILGLRTAGVV
jgi:2-C-methyl-D-erythritol 4-phosphate cytidylyltransferase